MNNKIPLKSFLESKVDGNSLFSPWKTVSQTQIDQFAEATGDSQWIHTDPIRCAKESPFGGTIAHGLFTLATIASGFFEVFETSDYQSVINYGCEKVRFPSTLPVGHSYRTKFSSHDVKSNADFTDFVFKAEVEKESSDRPACVAIMIFRLIHRAKL